MTDERIRAVLREVLDPELGVNIVDLGLVRQIAVDEGGARITIVMTSPACPLRDYLRDLVESTVAAHLNDGRRVIVDIVDDPPWSPDQMSDAARRQLE